MSTPGIPPLDPRLVAIAVLLWGGGAGGVVFVAWLAIGLEGLETVFAIIGAAAFAAGTAYLAWGAARAMARLTG